MGNMVKCKIVTIRICFLDKDLDLSKITPENIIKAFKLNEILGFGKTPPWKAPMPALAYDIYIEDTQIPDNPLMKKEGDTGHECI